MQLCKHSKNDVLRCCQNCQDFCFILQDISLALTIPGGGGGGGGEGGKHRDCSGHNLGRDKFKSHPNNNLCYGL